MTEGIDYCFIYPKDDGQAVHIKFLEGPYTGTTFKYGKVKFKEENDPDRKRPIKSVVNPAQQKLMQSDNAQTKKGDKNQGCRLPLFAPVFISLEQETDRPRTTENNQHTRLNHLLGEYRKKALRQED